MPLYPFLCENCGHDDDEYRKTGNFAPVETCPKCGKFEYIKQMTTCGSLNTVFAKPIEMYSVAVQDKDSIRALQLKCPDAKISDDPRDPMYGVPIAETRQAKLQVLKASKAVERK